MSTPAQNLAAVQADEAEKTIQRFKYMFWLLGWRSRNRVLFNAGVISSMPEKTVPQTIEGEIIRLAYIRGNAAELWRALESQMMTERRMVPISGA